MNDERFTINENKMNHILAVARLMYQMAIDDGKDEKYAEQMFLLGYLHDIGYEFCTTSTEHPTIGANILKESNYEYANQVLYHGKPNKKDISDTYAMDLLDKADLLIDHTGKYVGAKSRLEDIKSRYGENSSQYINAETMITRLKLI